MLSWLLLIATAVLPPSQDTNTGWALLALQHPSFPVEQSHALFDSSACHAFSFVYRAFGTSPENVLALRDYLANRNRNPQCHPRILIYADCGPCRPPRRPVGTFPIVLPHRTISQINRAIESRNRVVMGVLLAEYRAIAASIPPLDGTLIRVYPGLEDNYTNLAMTRIRPLMRRAFKGRHDIEIGRCAQHPVQEHPKEIHAFSVKSLIGLRRGDAMVGDGVPFPSVSTIRQVLAYALPRGIITLLWLPEHQGLLQPRDITKPMRKRTYRIRREAYYGSLLK